MRATVTPREGTEGAGVSPPSIPLLARQSSPYTQGAYIDTVPTLPTLEYLRYLQARVENTQAAAQRTAMPRLNVLQRWS